MFHRFGYPNPEPQKKAMWIQDFGMGDFVHAGMAGVFWFNDKENNYFGHEIYLLPGQQIPEHKHMKTKDAVAKKMYLAHRPNYRRDYKKWKKLAGKVFGRARKRNKSKK